MVDKRSAQPSSLTHLNSVTVITFQTAKKCVSYLDFILSCFQPKYLQILKLRRKKQDYFAYPLADYLACFKNSLYSYLFFLKTRKLFVLYNNLSRKSFLI